MFSPGSKPENKQQVSESSENQPKIPSISLPKGGGAIRGIGEKFAANPVTGTGSLSVPIFTSPGRSGFGPQLSLSYDSGAGNGPFGFGWNISLPSITRKTDKGLPKYLDIRESDVFILSGAEDLVPVFKKDKNDNWIIDKKGNLVFDEEQRDGYIVRRYRPRIEGLFARIERWTKNDNDVHWRSISKDNVLTIYGKDDNSRIFDPEHSNRIFSWLICETHDDKGNAIVYEYKPEDATGIDLEQAHECNRSDLQDKRRVVNRYLKRIKYGNRFSLLDGESRRLKLLSQEQIDNTGWMFEIVFDYEDHDPASPKSRDDEATDATGALMYPWKCRGDPFSSYRAGFEVRTYRLCQRVLMFHHFPDEEGIGADCLVRSTDFTYSYEENPSDASNPIYSFLLSIKQVGYKRTADGSYLSKSLPPIEFEYSQPIVDDTVKDVDSVSLENLPVGIDGVGYQLIDLHSESTPGILSKYAGAWFYKRNLSPMPIKQEDGKEQVKARFAPSEMVALKPNLALTSGAQFMDLASDGQPDVVVLDGPIPGLYEHDDVEGWQPFHPFNSRLNLNFHDPNLKLVDLDGDNHADVLITTESAFIWHPSLAEEGFGPANLVAQALDEEKGPHLVFADDTDSIYLADMSGDGLTDLVRIRNGEVCYWPNLGYCRFGAKITMDMPSSTDQPSYFDNPDQFDQKRIRLADIDGSGTTDIIYLHRDGVRLYFNQSGNSWSKPHPLNVFPLVDNITSVIPIDLLGNGTACLVWSSPLPGDARQQMKYVNLMGGYKPGMEARQQDRQVQKPHLLVSIKNNLGAETHIQYAPSTKFYLQDKLDGNPWITRLPFPVHVVERVETYDRINRNRFVTRYAYHHGYFDGEEREFRGFGMVEQWDTEEIGNVPEEQNSSLATNLDSATFVPPIHTKTWFHTGAYQKAGKISQHLAHEYYGAPRKTDADYDQKWKSFESTLLPDTVPLPELTPSEEREAYRALKGSMLRQEIYSDDVPLGSSQEIIERANTPYTVTEQNFTIETVQPKDSNRHAVFFVHPREALSYHYERNPDDPRISHAMTLEVDKYGNVLKSIAIGYGRKQSPLAEQSDRDKQTNSLVTYTENSVTKAIDDTDYPDDYRTPLPSESRTYELHVDPSTYGYEPSGVNGLFQCKDFVEKVDDKLHLISSGEHEVDYERILTQDKTRRLIEDVRTLYRKDDLSGLLDLGKLDPMALPGESYKLALTPGLINEVYGGRVTDAMLETEGCYVHSEGDKNWWIPSGKVFYSPKENDTPEDELKFAKNHFFLPHRFRDPFGNSTIVNYDSNKNDSSKSYDLLLTETYDALENRVTAENDYRVLQPKLMTDPNGNRSAAAFDALGMVVGTAIMGKEKEPDGRQKGDTLDEEFKADISLSEIQAFVSDPRNKAPDLLKGATSRIIYDVDRFWRCDQPPFAATLTREIHKNDSGGGKSPIQISLTYSDGFGREIQTKIQAESGNAPKRDPDIDLLTDGLPNGDIKPGKLILDENGNLKQDQTSYRWVGKGRTVYNNKGKPVKQYEPFFSSTHLYEEEPEMTDTGVTPVLFYDPVERVVATLHPNHTYEKVVFDPWYQQTYDVNDTVMSDPRTDADISGYVAEYFKQEASDPKDWKTWLQQRDVDPLNPPQDTPGLDPEKKAAIRTLPHANTPTVAYLDTLGRPFLTIANNGKDANGKDKFYKTRTLLDIEGNQRQVIDAKDRIVMRYDYDMLGNKIHQASMEAGERWMLNDVTGKPIRAWDSRNHQFRTVYDQLRRPTESYMSEGAGQELLVGRTVYGEAQSDPEAKNLRGKAYQAFDQAGVVTSEEYDFKGNLLRSHRQLAKDYKNTFSWPLIVPPDMLENEVFISSTMYDALNRPIQIIAPHNNKNETKINITQPVYNEANLLEREDVWLEQNSEPDGLLNSTTATQHAVKNIDYNAKGQRELIEYGNGVITTYEYDPLTFRLAHLQTLRGTEHLQDLFYTYDPAGNIIVIRDDAQQTIYFNGQVVKPDTEYWYDAIYRLIEASGREHIGQVSQPHTTWNDEFRVKLAHPNDGQAMRNYFEFYEYDEVGNILNLDHKAEKGNWIRSYGYDEKSQTEADKNSNRLSRTIVNPKSENPISEPYTYDIHGNMTSMPHLPEMAWDFKDELQIVNKGGGCKAYYVYDSTGQRVRKVIEQNDETLNERIYVGGYEVYRQYKSNNKDPVLERESLHIMDDKQRIALVDTKTIDTNNPEIKLPETLIRYQFGNHLGSAVLELDENAKVISYEEYYPYGSTSYQAVCSNNSGSVEVSTKRYRYTGKERDEETGLCYHEARYYLPWLGRWVNCDPKGLIDGSNMYKATSNNPLSYTDPTGESPVSDCYNAAKNGGPPVPQCMARVLNQSVESRPSRDHTLEPYSLPDRRMEAYYSSLEKPVSTPTRLVVFEEEKDRETRMSRRRLEAAIQGMEHLKDVTLPIGEELLKAYVGGKIIGYAFEKGLPLLERGALRAVESGASPEVSASVGRMESFLENLPLPKETNKILDGLRRSGVPTGLQGSGVPTGVKINLLSLNTGDYGRLTRLLEGKGLQVNHLNQNAAYFPKIPTSKGIGVAMEGNAFTEIGTPHFKFHESLESFWDLFRKGGPFEGQLPTNAQYGMAMENALRVAGFAEPDVQFLSKIARQQRISWGLAENASVPNIPGRINQSF